MDLGAAAGGGEAVGRGDTPRTKCNPRQVADVDDVVAVRVGARASGSGFLPQSRVNPMAMASTQPMTDDNDVEVREVQTAKVRREGTDKKSAIVSITKAIRAAGLEDGGSFRFDPRAIEELGMVPALGSPETADGRSESLTRNVREEGTGGKTLRLVLPEDVLEALDISDDEVGGDEPAEVSVWAGDQLVAFERSEERTVEVDRDEAEDS